MICGHEAKKLLSMGYKILGLGQCFEKFKGSYYWRSIFCRKSYRNLAKIWTNYMDRNCFRKLINFSSLPCDHFIISGRQWRLLNKTKLGALNEVLLQLCIKGLFHISIFLLLLGRRAENVVCYTTDFVTIIEVC